jgi:hypothetical protein
MAKKIGIEKNATFEFGGESYELVYDFNLICDAEPLVGANMLEGIARAVSDTLTAAQLRGLLFAFLQTKHPYRPATKDKPASGVSIDQAGRLIRIDTYPVIADAISAAFNRSMPARGSV